MRYRAERLPALIREAQQSGELSDELVYLLTRIAAGCWAKLKRSHPVYGKRASWDDARQVCFLRFLQVMSRMDTERNVLALVSTIFLNEIRMLARYARNYSRLLVSYAMARKC